MLNLDNVLAELTKLSRIPVCHFSENGELLKSLRFPYNPEYLPPFFRSLITDCINGAGRNSVYHKTLEGLPVIAFSYRMDDDNSCYVWGPCAYGRFSPAQQAAYNRLCKSSDFINDLPFSSIDRFTSEITLFLSVAAGRDLFQEDLFKGLMEQLGRESSQHSIHEHLIRDEALSFNHTMAEEAVMLNAIRKGDIDYIINALRIGSLDYPEVISDHQKNEEYMTVATIALTCRAAITGGISSKTALRLSDEYLKRLASCRNSLECMKLRSEAVFAFTQLVAENRENDADNRYIMKAKQIIREKITDTISLRDIASALHVNPSYLSRIFREHQGCTLTEYIRHKKIKQAKNILTYSDDDIITIAAWLGFSSPSYFTKIFKEAEGCTPSQYRANHKSF